MIAGLYLLADISGLFSVVRKSSSCRADTFSSGRADGSTQGIFGRVLFREKNKNQMEGKVEYGKIFHREESVEG